MPGASILFGILRCFNQRAVRDNPHSLTYDAEMVVGATKTGPELAKVVLNHYSAFDGPPFVEGAFYDVFGRVASIDSSFTLGLNALPEQYEFVVDAESVSVC